MKRWIVGLSFLLALIVACGVVFSYRSDLAGWWNGENRYKGKSTNYWRSNAQTWQTMDPRIPRVTNYRQWFKQENIVETVKRKFFSIQRQWSMDQPELHNGDLEGILVLLDLLRDDDPRVRMFAADGLGRIGKAASHTLPYLKKTKTDPNEWVRIAVHEAIWYIMVGFDNGLK